MEGLIKKIKGIFPITTTKAVYMDGTGKTLQQAIDNGELGGASVEATTNANFITDAFIVCDDVTFSKDGENITIQLSNKTISSTWRVYWSNGGQTTISVSNDILSTLMPLAVSEALVWDATNGITKITATYGSMGLPYNKLLLAFNYSGNITGGLLSHIWFRYYPNYYNYFKPERTYNIECKATERVSNRTFHSLWNDGTYLYGMECYAVGDFGGDCHYYNLSDLSYAGTFTQQFVVDLPHNGANNLRWVSCDYNQTEKVLAVGSSDNQGKDRDDMTVYLFYGAESWKDKGETITADNADYVTVNFYGDANFPAGAYSCKVCWHEKADTLIVAFNNAEYIYEVLLKKDSTGRYSGEYVITHKYQQNTPQYGPKQLSFYKGALYYPIKRQDGGLYIMRTTLEVDGQMKHDILLYDKRSSADGSSLYTGSPEGIDIIDGRMIFGHANYAYLWEYEL